MAKKIKEFEKYIVKVTQGAENDVVPTLNLPF